MEKITKKSYLLYIQELNYIKQKVIPDIKIKIENARKNGDFSENAELHSELQNKISQEKRCIFIENILSNSEVIDTKDILFTDKIQFGCKIIIQNTSKTSLTKSFFIVGKNETNMHEGKIYYLSPLAKTLIGKKIGDTIIFMNNTYKVININYEY